MADGWLDSLICGLPCVVRQGIRLDRLIQPETTCCALFLCLPVSRVTQRIAIANGSIYLCARAGATKITGVIGMFWKSNELCLYLCIYNGASVYSDIDGGGYGLHDRSRVRNRLPLELRCELRQTCTGTILAYLVGFGLASLRMPELSAVLP